MARAPKYAQVMSVIERRVREGDYLLRDIPGERALAEQVGVSYMTARRAVSELLRSRVLIRRDSGMLEVHPDYMTRKVSSKIVLLYPDFPSPYFASLRMVVAQALEKRGLTIRPVQYVHWDDPVVADAITNILGALVIPSTEPIPCWVLAALRVNPVVILDGDCTADGICSIRLFPDSHVERVLEHLYERGHRSIDCVNAQPHNPAVDRRIDFWREWLARRGCRGELRDNPAPSYSDPTTYAHSMIARLLDDGQIDATALLCTTFPAAVAASRAYWERGRRVGHDVAICSINIEHPARFVCPSITGLDLPDLSDVLARCFERFDGVQPPHAPLLLEPLEPVLFVGESSGAPLARGV